MARSLEHPTPTALARRVRSRAPSTVLRFRSLRSRTYFLRAAKQDSKPSRCALRLAAFKATETKVVGSFSPRRALLRCGAAGRGRRPARWRTGEGALSISFSGDGGGAGGVVLLMPGKGHGLGAVVPVQWNGGEVE